MIYLQGKISSSRQSLPIAIFYSIVIWLVAGLLQGNWWIQFVAFLATTGLLVLMNNLNVLIRVYSRFVSISFILLTCAASFLFPSLRESIVQLCVASSLLTLFNAYEDEHATGWIFYTFLCLSIGSLLDVHLFFLVPLYWFLQKLTIQAFSLRTLFSSLIGLVTPYWFVLGWTLYHNHADFTSFLDHFHALENFDYSISLGAISQQELVFLILVEGLSIIGALHFLLNSYHDKIQVRQLYTSFILVNIYVMGWLMIQPDHYNMLIRLLVITASPLIGHFIALTNTKYSNIAFILIMATIFVITLLNLWTSSLLF